MLVDHHRTRDREPLARALADILGGEERLEHPRTDLLWNARAVVGDADADLVGTRGLDVDRDASPQITDADGKPMTKNPLKDERVRRAMSMPPFLSSSTIFWSECGRLQSSLSTSSLIFDFTACDARSSPLVREMPLLKKNFSSKMPCGV